MNFLCYHFTTSCGNRIGTITLFDWKEDIISDQIYGKIQTSDKKRQSLLVHLTALPHEVEKIFHRIESDAKVG
jgi:hypothetical protein